jgi:phosphoribosylglycinamide formyltransferase-1
MSRKIRIGALISGGGTNLQAIIDACKNQTIDGTMVFVGSDNPGAKGLERARRHGIPTVVVNYGEIIKSYRKNPADFIMPEDADLADIQSKQSLLDPKTAPEKLAAFIQTRVAAESRLLAAMASHRFDLLVLAGFMRNLTPYFIDRVNIDAHRIMNIHPALLPAFPGVDGYGDTFRYGCKLGGCTVHFIDYGEDSGPIIGQRAFPIHSGDTLEDVKKKGLALEWKLYPECIQLFAQNRLRVVSRTFSLDNGQTLSRSLVQIL